MPRLVPAVARALEILELFQTSRTLSVPEICDRLDLPRSSAHELVNTLMASGFLAPAEDRPHCFTLGLRAFELGNAYAASLDLIREGTGVTREIAEACNETAQLGVLDGNDVVYVVKADSTRAVRLVSAVGSRVPAHLTAIGKMLLSDLSDEEISAKYADTQSLPRMTPNSVGSLTDLLGELSRVREQGVAFEDRESNPDLCCVAAPVFNQHRGMVAAIGVAVPVNRTGPERQAELAELVRKGAERLSLKLGCRAMKRVTTMDDGNPVYAA